MNRTDIINLIIRKYRYTRYLEIGISDPRKNFDRINVPYKDGVDPKWRRSPAGGGKFEITSDEFFGTTFRKYDIVFIDGLHHHEQVGRDFSNSLGCLNRGGTIVLHDCNPTTEVMQSFPRCVSRWTGDAWKAVFKIRCQDPDIQIFTVDVDFGCCVVQRGIKQTVSLDLLEKHMTWRFFDKHRNAILNLVSAEAFERWLKN